MPRICVALLLTALACGAEPVEVETPALDAIEISSAEEKLIYFIGFSSAKNFDRFVLEEHELDIALAGLRDGMQELDSRVDAEEIKAVMKPFMNERRKRLAERESAAGERFIREAANREGAVSLDSGLVMRHLVEGPADAPRPEMGSKVKIHYHGTLHDGTVFDSSVERGTPATFPMNGVLECWSQALPRMRVGGRSEIFCPAELAYGDQGAPPRINPGAALGFEIQVLEVLN